MNACKSMKIAMAKREWNQAKVAEESGLSPTAVSRLANNQNWTADSLKRISELFGMEVSDFIKLGED